ncbi:hypothetical protein [Candidatus Nitrosotenuis cloacae]|uniref:hypothetical protein n=1 Tax=Candidatus Nitrosotenuis cloacae TaxID=1603555 RepID=UPI00228016C6|nr:hypothetical protein [Candidatus Nitrosotenuis cloacae]
MSRRYLKKVDLPKSEEPIDAFRSIHFKEDLRTNSEKVQDSVNEAGHETRSVNQVVKLVNLHLSEKVKRLEELKKASKRFDEELNMFTSGIGEEQPTINNLPASDDLAIITDQLSSMINKYGFEKLSSALDRILAQNPNLKNQF